jgi:hypothetical protein
MSRQPIQASRFRPIRSRHLASWAPYSIAAELTMMIPSLLPRTRPAQPTKTDQPRHPTRETQGFLSSRSMVMPRSSSRLPSKRPWPTCHRSTSQLKLCSPPKTLICCSTEAHPRTPLPCLPAPFSGAVRGNPETSSAAQGVRVATAATLPLRLLSLPRRSKPSRLHHSATPPSPSRPFKRPRPDPWARR